MSNLALNQNQTLQSAIIGMVTMDPQPNTMAAQLNPSSSATVITAGQAVKLFGTAGAQVIVDICTSAADGPVFGVIAYDLRGNNKYVAGDIVEIVGRGGIVMLKTSAAVVRGTNVSVTNQTVSTNDPTVATDTTVADYITGVALGQASGANILIKVQISQGIISATGVISVTP